MNEPGQSTLRRVGVAVLKVALVAALCIALWFITWILDRASIKVAWFTYGWTYGSLLNAIPGIFVFLLLLALCNRVGMAFTVTLALTVALYAANFLKLKYLDIPVSFNDVYLLGNLHVATLEVLSAFVRPARVLILLLALALVIAVSLRFEHRYFLRRSVPRLAVAVIAAFGLASAAAGAGWVGGIYGAPAMRIAPFAPMLTQLHAGLVSSILQADAAHRQTMTAPIDTGAAGAFLAMRRDAPLPADALRTGPRPDIVVIQSESFFDPTILASVETTAAMLPNLHRALAAGAGGTMLPPTFGGGTLRTEFEVLTGIPMAAYPDVEFPYLQIVQPRIPSIVHVLRDGGYRTIAIHPNNATFWNRNVAFRELGFERFISKSAFPAGAKRDGWYMSDQAMTDQIIATLDAAREPTLVFAISIEAHGPYLQDPVADPARRDAVPAPPALHGNALQAYRNYVYHIENADRQMGRLWDFLVKRGRPFLLVFYGDHLAPLPHVYAEGGFDNGLSGPDQFVPWFMVGTSVGHADVHVEGWMLGSEILRAAGVPLTPYYRLVAEAQTQLAVDAGGARASAVRQGMYALARLYLRGRLEAFLAQSEDAGGARVAHIPES